MKYLKKVVIIVILFCVILAVTIVVSYNYLSSRSSSVVLAERQKASPTKLYKRKPEKRIIYTPVAVEENEVIIQDSIVYYKKNNVIFKIPSALTVNSVKYKYSQDESSHSILIKNENMKKIGFLQKNIKTQLYEIYNVEQGELTIYSDGDNIYLNGKYLLKYEKII